MLKYIFWSFLLIHIWSFQPVVVTADDSNKLLWEPGKKIAWHDFQGPVPDSVYARVASIQTAVEMVDVGMAEGFPKVTVHCYMIKKESWTMVNDDHTLAHEQLHFDISELFARKIRRAFDNLNRRKITDFEEYQKVYDSLIDELEQYQKLYDSEVYFNDEKQQYWYKKVETELDKLKKYELAPDA